jgi:hypothetical protein
LPEVNLAALDQAQQRGGGGRGGPGGGGGRGGGGRGGGGRGGGPQTPQGKMDYKFNSQGADFTGTEYAQMLPNVARVIIINSTNSSGASLETMAGKNRVVITATRSATEANDTVFYEHFLAALQDSAADEDKDKKVSVWETFKFASDAVDRFYKEQGRLATEHPMLSDNGGEAVNTTVKDPPVLSRYTVFNVDRPLTATDARLQTLLEQRREIEIKIQELKLREGIMAAPDFQKEMQERLLELAQKTAEINALTRQQEKK